jgi:hypothetical protein
MSTSKKGISVRLTNASVAIHNTLDDSDIASCMAAYGYDSARMAEGQALLDKANGALQAQVALRGEQQNATATLKQAHQQAYLAYKGLAAVAKAALGPKNPSLASLGLDRPVPKRQSEFLTMAAALFENVLGNPDLAAAVGRYYTNDRLLAEKAKITALASANHVREASKGSAQQATLNQRAALHALANWISAFRRVARVALHDQPQLLEKLGIFVRNTRTPAQRQAPAKAAETRKANREALKVVAPAATPKEEETQAVA